MTSIVVAMLVILVVAACTVGLVLLGLADRAARAAEHLNGEGEPPARFIKLIESNRGR